MADWWRDKCSFLFCGGLDRLANTSLPKLILKVTSILVGRSGRKLVVLVQDLTPWQDCAAFSAMSVHHGRKQCIPPDDHLWSTPFSGPSRVPWVRRGFFAVGSRGSGGYNVTSGRFNRATTSRAHTCTRLHARGMRACTARKWGHRCRISIFNSRQLDEYPLHAADNTNLNRLSGAISADEARGCFTWRDCSLGVDRLEQELQGGVLHRLLRL